MKIQLTEGDKGIGPVVWGRIISTHALTEGDSYEMLADNNVENFNSRPHGRATAVSTAAEKYMKFQLTPSRRATILMYRGVHPTLFQLTPSRRATVYVTHWPPCILYFNSRPHGGRLIWICLLNYSFVFQLTPSRRATVSPGIAVCKFLFQLTPSRRATSVGNISATEVLVFQLTPSRRATTGLMPQKRHTAFQLTPSRRATIYHL